MTTSTILLVEDEVSVRMTLAALLDLEGFNVLEAGSAAEALEILGKTKIDLVLSDIRMPGMSGVEMFTKLRATHTEIPVILMTAFAVEDQIQTAIDGGVFTVLPKPFEVDEAVGAVRNALRRPVVVVHDAAAANGNTDLTELLGRRGIKAKATRDPEEAVQLVKEKPVDVFVADVRAQGNAALRVRSANPQIALVVIADDTDASAVQHLSASGIYAFLRKPVHAKELIEVIARARRGRPLP